MEISISRKVKDKLRDRHQVADNEIFECFFNRTHVFLIDTREEHLTDPVTKWFISSTDLGRQLKVCFIEKNGVIEIKTAYGPTKSKAADLYYKLAKQC